MWDYDELLEWVEVYGNYYVMLCGLVEDVIENGCDILFDIDIQGIFQLYDKMCEDVVFVFILLLFIVEMKLCLYWCVEDVDDVIVK